MARNSAIQHKFMNLKNLGIHRRRKKKIKSALQGYAHEINRHFRPHFRNLYADAFKM
jgi:hypothetical protein